MTKGKHIQQAFDDIDPDNFGICGVRDVGVSVVTIHAEKEEKRTKYIMTSQRTNSTFGFCRHKNPHKKNQKSYFFSDTQKQ